MVLNVGLLSFLCWKSFSRHGDGQRLNDRRFQDVSAVLQKELNLTEQQAEQIKKLRSDFFEKEQLLSTSIRAERDSMNQVMFNKNADSILIQSLAKNIADNEYQMEMLRFQQAQQLKSICTPEQLERFEKLVREIRDYFRPDEPKRKN